MGRRLDSALADARAELSYDTNIGKERITIEIDTALMEKLRAAGLDPIQHIERLLARQAVQNETETGREERWAALRAENQAGLDAYDAFIEEHGLWSDGLRQF